MIKRRKVFIPNKKIIDKRRLYLNRRKAKIKRFITRHIFRLRRKYGRIRTINKKFLKRKIRIVRYHYFLFGLFRRKLFQKIKNSTFFSRFNFRSFFFKFRKYLFSNFIFYKDFKLSKFKSRYTSSRKYLYKKSRSLIIRFRPKFNHKRYFFVNRRRFYNKSSAFKKFSKSRIKFYKKKNTYFSHKSKYSKRTIFIKSRHHLLFFAKMRSYFKFKSNSKIYKKFIRRYRKKSFKSIYFYRFKRKYFSSSYNYKFWRRFFVLKFTRYYLAFKFKSFFNSKFPSFYKTYFSRRKVFFPYSFFLKNFTKSFFSSKNFRKKFKKKICKIFPRKSFPFFNNKFFFPVSFFGYGANIIKRKFLFINPFFFRRYRKSWFFHSHKFKRSRYLNFFRFSKLNYFKQFIFFNKQKFKLIYSRLLSLSKDFRIFRKFKFNLFFKKKIKFKRFSGFYSRFTPHSLLFSTYPRDVFSRSIFTKFFDRSSFFYSDRTKFRLLSRIGFKLKKFKFFKLKGFFRRRGGFFFKSRKYKRNRAKKFKFYNRRKFNKKINIIKYRKFRVFSKRKKSYFYKFYRRLSLFFKRRSANPFPFKARSFFKTAPFTLKQFFFNNFFSRNLFYYSYNKFSRQFYSFRRRHKIYCSAFSARFRKLYRVKNRLKRRRKKFLRRIRFNFFLADFYNKKNFDSYDKEKNFVSLFHSKNNFFIYVHNANGKIIYQSTNGMVGYRGPKKPTAFAAEINARRVARAIKYSKLFPIVLVIRTRLSSFVRSAIRGINYIGVKFSYVKRIILRGHNGLRKPGLRRT